jgi:hypothetical protein
MFVLGKDMDAMPSILGDVVDDLLFALVFTDRADHAVAPGACVTRPAKQARFGRK